MGFLDRLFGSDEPATAAPRRDARTDDERALERYRYLLRTAPHETIEQVHAEAFAKLTDEQRAVIYEELSKGAGTGERPLSSEPATLARAATRAEMRQPGTLERSFSNPAYQGLGFGSMIASSLIGTVAGYVIGSALVSAFLPWDGGNVDAAGDQSADSGSDAGSDGGDASGGFGDSGGDFGGGDFGGFDGGF
jgi:GNAT superfamily N-acetyltransferase